MIHRFSVEWGGHERQLSVEALDGGRYRVTIDGKSQVFDARKVLGGARAATWSLVPEGGGPAALIDVDGTAPDLAVTHEGASVPVRLVDARNKLASFAAARAMPSGPLAVRSPMHGKVVKVLVAVGQAVKAGAPVVVVEAMKMENELRAPRDGTVEEVGAREGQAVEAGQTLATIA
jgi:biotin carboxyl carrier protein